MMKSKAVAVVLLCMVASACTFVDAFNRDPAPNLGPTTTWERAPFGGPYNWKIASQEAVFEATSVGTSRQIFEDMQLPVGTLATGDQEVSVDVVGLTPESTSDHFVTSTSVGARIQLVGSSYQGYIAEIIYTNLDIFRGPPNDPEYPWTVAPRDPYWMLVLYQADSNLRYQEIKLDSDGTVALDPAASKTLTIRAVGSEITASFNTLSASATNTTYTNGRPALYAWVVTQQPGTYTLTADNFRAADV